MNDNPFALFPFHGPMAFAFGDRVRKNKGSSWQGRVVGFYSTSLTPIGYAIESEREPGSVQIYPEAALEPVTDVPQPLLDIIRNSGSLRNAEVMASIKPASQFRHTDDGVLVVARATEQSSHGEPENPVDPRISAD